MSLVPASLSYRYVENPIRYHPRIRGRAVVALAGACVAVGLAGSLALLGADRVLSATTTLGSFTARTKDHLDEAHQCHGPVVVKLAGRRACTWTVPRSRGAVVLIGDSNAGHFAEPVVRAANRDGFDAIVATYYSCPFADLLISGSVAGLTIDEGACRSFDRRSIAAIARLRPSLVIVGARVDLRLEDRHEALRAPGAARATTAPAQKAALYTAGLRRYLLRLHRAGVPVLLVDPVPRIVGSRADPNTCAVLLVIAEACRGRVGRAQATRALRGARTVHRRAAQGIGGVATVDFEADLCEPSYCASDARGRNIYRDTGHLSVTGALALTDRFAALIRANARPGRRT